MRAVALQIPPPTGELRVVHCICGATRQAPVNLAIISCVQCGAAMGQVTATRVAQPPSRALLAIGCFATQLLGMLAFALALSSVIRLRMTDDLVISVLVGGGVCVFAGGAAYRGSVVALGVCAILDLVIATALLSHSSSLTVITAPLPAVAAQYLETACIILGCVAAMAAAECLVAAPQARHFARWRAEQIRRAVFVRG
jgi:hypothetical protein